jgi:mono/diheme cytochrome c family protein
MASAILLIWIKDRGRNFCSQLRTFTPKHSRVTVIGKSIPAGLAVAAIVMAVIVPARPQDADKGRTQYVENCAGCHGDDGKGAGPLSAKLKTKPTDLTVLAKRNHGSFDAASVYQMIDGRNGRAAHRNAEMPIWGCRHDTPAIPAPAASNTHHRKIPKRVVSAMKGRQSELDSLLDLPCGSEQAVQDRIHSIVDYLSELQTK